MRTRTKSPFLLVDHKYLESAYQISTLFFSSSRSIEFPVLLSALRNHCLKRPDFTKIEESPNQFSSKNHHRILLTKCFRSDQNIFLQCLRRFNYNQTKLIIKSLANTNFEYFITVFLNINLINSM